jgi:hypothetical protein
MRRSTNLVLSPEFDTLLSQAMLGKHILELIDASGLLAHTPRAANKQSKPRRKRRTKAEMAAARAAAAAAPAPTHSRKNTQA